ncbi:formylmethanofuran dehydrogenase [Methylotenera sp. N17]|uniref:formylmethanofuran dehydrogenase n=1 Tax=Methylotenera sp. N17 TaxID=1502761 RepID=UPI0006926070|nr:formylmethanofuran dehydrogenase [Methylotenera sp. N17]
MQTSTTKTVNATCPACGLLCDDVTVSWQGPDAKLDVTVKSGKPCGKTVAFFSRPLNAATPMIAGKPVSLVEAIAHAGKLVQQAQMPLVAGLSTDLAGFRAAYQFAHPAQSNRPQANMMHMNVHSSLRNTKVLQSTGWQTTTLTEVKNRADMIVCIGTDVVHHNPRFFERAVWTDEAMFTDASARKVVYLGGDDLNTAPGVSPKGELPTVLPCATIDLPEVTAALRALLQGKVLKVDAIAGVKVSALTQLVEQLKQAKYAVLIWVAKDLDFPHAELTIQNITESVVILNQQSRAMGLGLGGSDGDTTVNYAHTWLDGLTLGEQDVDAHDLIVWINSFSPDKPMPNVSQPVVAFGHPDTQFTTPPEVFIPVATPGLDAAGTLFRVDSSVVLPLKKVRESTLPTLAEVLLKLEAQLA